MKSNYEVKKNKILKNIANKHNKDVLMKKINKN